MATGTVKFFNTTKGFGFITPEDGSKDVFVHISGLTEGTTIEENDTVSFETEEGQKGINAINVEKIDAAV
ncbi:MAG: cold-shock protein [Candidatus Absconditabacterales bacterium]